MGGRDFRTTIDDKDIQILSREDLETEIRRRTVYLENVMDTMVDLLLRLDTEGKIEMANRAVTDILGYEPGDIQGKPVDVLFADAGEDEELSDMLGQGELFDRLFTTGHVKDVDISFRTQDGDAIPMSLSASMITEDDQPIGIVCVAKDISDRKEALERAEFLHSLLRHDLSNKLQVIDMHLQLLDGSDVSTEGMTHVEKSLAGVDEAIELIENVRTLSSIKGEPDLASIRLQPILRQCVDRLENLRAEKGVVIDLEVDQETRVLAGRILNELFDNLIENALYHSEADLIQVSASERDTEVLITVQDDGVGIPDAEKERILKKGEKGTGSTGSGLGLHLASEIAESYGGSLAVRDSELGGARFDVTLQEG